MITLGVFWIDRKYPHGDGELDAGWIYWGTTIIDIVNLLVLGHLL